jgi:hypothetical protein
VSGDQPTAAAAQDRAVGQESQQRERGPAREAIAEAFRSLRHWSSIITAAAVIPVAHWLATSHQNGDGVGLVYGASFAVFALLLPAVGILRDYIDRRMARLQEVFRQAQDASIEALQSQDRMFNRLAGTVAPLQRGIVLAMIAAVVSSAALIAPDVTVWEHAPGLLVFSLGEILAAVALVCLVSAVAAMFPFTWHLLVRSDQLRFAQAAALTALAGRQARQAADQASAPKGLDREHPRPSTTNEENA